MWQLFSWRGESWRDEWVMIVAAWIWFFACLFLYLFWAMLFVIEN